MSKDKVIIDDLKGILKICPEFSRRRELIIIIIIIIIIIVITLFKCQEE